MKIVYKVLLANIGLSIIAALIFLISQGVHDNDSFAIIFGLACIAIALCDLFICVILFTARNGHREWAQGFLLSCGVLVLIGFAACSTALNSLH